MKKLFVLATLGVLSLSSFKFNSLEDKGYRCRFIVYSHNLYGQQFQDYWDVPTDSQATCNDIIASFND